NQNLKIFILDLDTGELIRTVDRFNGGYGVGVGGPIAEAFGGRLFTQGLDYDEDGTTDYIIFGYANKNGKNWDGGLLFADVRSKDPYSWNFMRYFEDTRPIIAKVEYMKCFDKWYAYFGTGRWFYKTDESDIKQSNVIYGVHLNCDKVQGCHPNLNFAHGSREQCSSNVGVYSWKILLEKNPEGYFPERVITDPSVTDFNVIAFVSMEPSGDICGFGGRTRVWALNCATGGALAEECPQYPIENPQGKILLQLSGGDIQDITLKEFRDNSAFSRTSPWMQGTPPPAPPRIVPPAKDEKFSGEILLWLEK
ncbi:MAG: hypothetical protein GXO21_03045, partial [Aquificae bacterium]|nr:hypothetical protein [Aquificota bacterium]